MVDELFVSHVSYKRSFKGVSSWVIPVIMFGNLFPRHSCTGVLTANIVADAVVKNIMRRLILRVILLPSKKEGQK